MNLSYIYIYDKKWLKVVVFFFFFEEEEMQCKLEFISKMFFKK